MTQPHTPPERYSRDGYLSHLLMHTRLPDTDSGKERHLALYKREKNGIFHYEVVILVWVDSTTIGASVTEARLALPSSSQWGKMGWTFTEYRGAQDKYDSLRPQD